MPLSILFTLSRPSAPSPTPSGYPLPQAGEGSHSRGLSLIEVGIALVVVAVILAGLAALMFNSQHLTQLNNEALQLNAISQGAEDYIASITPTNVSTYPLSKTVRIKDLKNNGFLADEVKETGSKGQQYILLVRKITPPPPPPHHSPAPPKLIGLVVSTNGKAFTDAEAGQIVSIAGAAAGFISSTKPKFIQGDGGAWRADVHEWQVDPAVPLQAGHIMELIGGGYSHTGGGRSSNLWWLARKDLGDPAYNEMAVDLHMSGHKMRRVNTLYAATLTARGGNSQNSTQNYPRIDFDQVSNILTFRAPAIFYCDGQGPFTSVRKLYCHDNKSAFALGLLSGSAQPNTAYGMLIRFTPELGGSTYDPNGELIIGQDETYEHGSGIAGGRYINLSLVGNAYSGAEAGFGTASDQRLKTELYPLAHPLELLKQVQGVSFRWKNREWKNRGQSSIGVIAQDIEKVFPEVISADRYGLKFVSYDKLIVPLIEGVRALDSQDHQLYAALIEGQQRLNAEKLALIKLKAQRQMPLTDLERALCAKACSAD